ncbi:protein DETOXIFICATION 27-like [Impatiens glandulifera]|uniref:protein DETOXIFICATION 27-like n=1 Tax=Impatiens glandulifera TaxID=253017 RepID=UPI001FB17F78|nr:protein DETOXIFICATION 27-like [Impatiens glandulifera]
MDLGEVLIQPDGGGGGDDNHSGERLKLKNRVWIETKLLWHIVGPSIFSRIATYSMNIVTQSFVGHIGDLELASFAIANNVFIGFNFGLLLGMASALETLCGQAYGGKKYNMLGVYLQRSWIVLFSCCFLLLPLYIYATPILKLLGEPDDVAELSGSIALWLIPLHFSFAFVFPVQRFLQSQLHTAVLAWNSSIVFILHIFFSWLFIYPLDLGIVGAALALNLSWWLTFAGMFGYTLSGVCGETWTGFSIQAFSGLWEFFKLSVASGVMLCLENWYYRILLVMTGKLKNSTIEVDALSVCTSISGWEMMIPLAFFAATGVRVANELGAGNGKAARFAAINAVIQSTILGIIICVLILVFYDPLVYIFTSSSDVISAANKLAVLLGVTILLNSIQPVLSGIAVGSGWQGKVAYVNLATYYIIGLPIGLILGFVFNLGVEAIWGGMIFGGTFIQTVVLIIITALSNWDKEADKAIMHIQNWSSSGPTPRPDDEESET